MEDIFKLRVKQSFILIIGTLDIFSSWKEGLWEKVNV